MFEEILIKPDLSKIHFQDSDKNEIIDKVNSASFVKRFLPGKELESIIKENTPKKIGAQNCHSITSTLIKEKSNLEIVYGYLMIGKVPIDFDLNSPYLIVDICANSTIEGCEGVGQKAMANNLRENSWVMKIDKETDRLMLKLIHHSVVRDEDGTHLECLKDKYPLASGGTYKYGYVFLPHLSAKLLADKSDKLPCHIEISCSMH